ncbi:hypothetical protein KKA01_00775 [Patescibacteria group bacterium]|nr:hypothetical protein [Patescibacteria group bacterium]
MNDFGKEHFIENRNLFGDISTEPEKFNLYGGLADLANSLREMSDRISNLERKM